MRYNQAREFTLLMVREKTTPRPASKVFNKTVTAPGDIINAVIPLYEGMDREKFIVGALNTSNKIIGYNIVSIGTLDSALVHPREVFKFAILSSAHSIFLFHNHPSGNMEPSSEDINLTRRLVEAGELLGIGVLDHVIIGHNGDYTSMKTRGLI
jgi:DNA repair protein RadC